MAKPRRPGQRIAVTIARHSLVGIAAIPHEVAMDEGEDLPAPQKVERIQQNMLAAGERRLLTWLCARMPAWVTPDLLTAFGFCGALMIFASYALSNRDPAWLWLAVAGYVVHWFGDSMDGSLARFRKTERPNYGYFIDHSTDALATMLIVGGLGLTPHMRLDVALCAVIAYLLLSMHAFLAARVMGEFKLSYMAAGPTELRLMLIGLTIAMYVLGPRPGRFAPYSGFDLFAGTIAAILVVLFIIQTASMAQRLRVLGK